MPIRFRLRWIPLCATLVVAAAGIALGQWQTRRADEKLAIQQKMAERERSPPLSALTSSNTAEADEFRQVKLRGEFVPRWTVYLENRPYQGATGFYVLTPFKIAGSDQAIVVARGWAPRNAVDRTRVPPAPVPVGEVHVEGILRSDAGHVLQLGRADAPTPGAILQNLEMAAYAKASGLQLLPLVVEQTSRTDDHLVRDWPAPLLGIDRHRGYAVQWYALAAMALVFFVVTGLRRGRNGKS